MVGVELRRLDVVMNRKLTVAVSQICVVRFLFVLLSPVVFRSLVEMVGRFLMIYERRDDSAPKFLTRGSPLVESHRSVCKYYF